jgi:NADPH:quinone reductase
VIPDVMQAVRITGPGGPQVLVLEERAVPQPAAHELLIRVRAAGVNRHDLGQRRRGHPPPGATDIPGLEVAGEVLACGAEAGARFRPGERVCALVNGGGYAQFCIADMRTTLACPEALGDAECAALPEALYTLWHNLIELCALAAGEWLLIHGGASGVGSIGIQLARALGAKVMVSAGSPEKCEAARALGAAVACNYRSEDFVALAQAASGGRGMDVILDMAGGLYAERNLQALAPDGRITHLTAAGEPRFNAPLELIMRKRARITGSLLRPLEIERKAAITRALETRVWPLLGSAIRPLIDRQLPLAQAAEAHACLEAGQPIGKLLLVP